MAKGSVDERAGRIGVWGLLEAVALLTAAASIAGHFGAASWALDLCSHFRMQYFVGGALLCALLSYARRRRIAAIVGFTAAVDLLSVAPLYTGAPPVARSEAPTLRLLVFNVNASNQAYGDILAYLRSSDAEVIVILEAGAAWIAQLERIGAPYRMAINDPATGNFGIAALTRVPLERARIVELSPRGYPSIELKLPRGDRGWTLLATHPPPPVGAALSQQRDEQLANVAHWAKVQSGPHAVVGDLNTTAFSHPFATLLQDASLSDSERGFGYQASWPFGVLALAPLRIPIDHVLVSDALTVHERALGPNLGSDHLPLRVTLAERR